MTYPLTFYVQSLPPKVGGCAKGPVIRILEKYRNDRGIYEHELLHVKQWAALSLLGLLWWAGCYHFGFMQWAGLGIVSLAFHQVLYTIVPAYKLWAEVRCYREQAKHYPDDRRPLFAQFIALNYGLKVTPEHALALLRK